MDAVCGILNHSVFYFLILPTIFFQLQLTLVSALFNIDIIYQSLLCANYHCKTQAYFKFEMILSPHIYLTPRIFVIFENSAPLSLRRGGEDSTKIREPHGVRSKMFHIRRKIFISSPTQTNYDFIFFTKLHQIQGMQSMRTFQCRNDPFQFCQFKCSSQCFFISCT